MLIDRRNFARHRPWVIFALAATALSLIWYWFSSRGSSQWPGGGSQPGIVFGTIGGLLILFEFALWGRKKVRSWRIGRAQTWMIAHIWLGLLTVPLLVLHSGFRWGGSLSTILMVLFLVVIASGVWGLALQQIIPTRILNQVPAETIHSQIGRMVDLMVEDANRLVEATCGPQSGEDPDGAEGDEARPDEEAEEATVPTIQEPRPPKTGSPISHLTVGAVQIVGKVQGKVLVTKVPKVAIAGAEPLRDVYRSSILDYLKDGRLSKSPLAVASKADGMFRELRTNLNPATYEVIDILENLCDQRRQLDRQDRLHRWLHNWLWVHLPLSIALVILMFFHVWIAFKYR